MKMKTTTDWAVLAGLLALAQPIQAHAQNQAPPREAAVDSVNVTGVGKATVTPDRATFNAGVQTLAASVQAAVQENSARVAAVVAALRKLGLSDKDIRTSYVSIDPQRDHQPGKQPRITGYQVSNTVTVTLGNPAEAGRFLQAVVDAGANTVSGVSFLVSDPARGREQALQAAYADARAKAETLAKASGRGVGRALWISEGSAVMPPPRPMAYARAAEMQAVMPVEPGAEELSFSVSVMFELK
jgi:uncharacterized protein YggE